jgi:phage shock protein E
MKQFLTSIITFIAFIAMSSLSAGASGQEQIEYRTFDDNIQVIDVRTHAEFNEGHLPKALHIPHTTILQGQGFADLDKTKPIVLYCRTGARSGQAKVFLEAQGFTDVTNAGGISELIIPTDKTRK